ncbi:hypothetical protein evm_013867 [Chilo suppressalis]|nr:hypothetical protein evm_013867 [Chilo suppressalis]
MSNQLRRRIIAVDFPYYKILFFLGTCTERIIYRDSKIWGGVKMNRIFDIHYKSSYGLVTISRVEIRLIIDNTDCYSYSVTGIGHTEFSAALILPMNVGIIFYQLTIYTCPENTSPILPPTHIETEKKITTEAPLTEI